MKHLFLNPIVSKCLLLLSALTIVWSCDSSDDNDPGPDPEPTFEIAASVDFGCTVDALKAAQEAAGN